MTSWTPEEDARLGALLDGGMSVRRIAEELGYTWHAVYTRMRVLGLPPPTVKRAALVDEVEDPAALRRRWLKKLPALKERLRQDLGL